MKYLYFLATLGVVTLLPTISSAQTELVTAGNTIDVRISGDLDELPLGGNNGDDNGGADSKLVGLNLNNIQNWALVDLDLDPVAGSTVISATITITVSPVPLNNPHHGDTDDFFTLHELYAGNAGWLQGTRTIGQPAANQADDAATFQNRADVGPTPDAGDIPWVDATGANVDNFIGAFNPTALNTNTVPGWNTPDDAPTFIEFEMDPATVQAWIDAGTVPGIVFAVNDGGDNQSRFNFLGGQNFQLNVTRPSTATLLGDVNLDGAVNFLDISPFIAVLSANGFQLEADVNGDDAVNFLDISAFIDLL